ncbi:TetR/AcrR family transcriptional regulator [Auritidibacter ignavus]|uniref:TetR/AcrR family transcriptional regulator n=1 Tax=Auritidibacter ignavus TaxID=678932 RepID=A0AAJ6ALW9_9MICC|nr:TetR/AcrR family transcriptional regulator [Auritidibacter ignavus]PXA80279.1 hypothetical protein DCC26_04190 [Auritidibacter sp. NML120779]WGH93263.1 TetR/AcrR family transcriptional regulator [Auritidibacter ignavus]
MTRLPRSQRREQLLTIAAQHFGINGYVRSSMDAIAKEAAISKPVLYQHFEGKEDIYRAIFNDHLKMLGEKLTQAFDEESDSERQCVYKCVAAAFEFASRPDRPFRVILDRSTPLESELDRVRREFLGKITDKIHTLMVDDSHLTDQQTRLVSSMVTITVISAAHGWTYMSKDQQQTEELGPNQTAEIVTDMLREGISVFRN